MPAATPEGLLQDTMLKYAVIAGAAALSAAGAAAAVLTLDPAHRQAAPAQVAVATAAAPERAVEPEPKAAPSPPPSAPSSAPQKTASIPKSADGHYWADARVNGARVRFLVDTGATAVALSPRDAARLGFPPSSLTYGHKVMTASGEARAAKVQLQSVSVNGARVEAVDAYVIERGLDTSLLGMTYLGRLEKFEATKTALILQP
jgi:aspartyl protease family protein